MWLVEDFNSLPPLTFLTRLWIVKTIWSREDIVYCMDECYFIPNTEGEAQKWIPIRNLVNTIIRLSDSFPDVCVPGIKRINNVIFDHIRKMITTRPISPEITGFPVNHWTLHGTVDVKKTEELLVLDDRKNLEWRYGLASHNCFILHITALFDELSRLDRERLLAQKSPIDQLMVYWTHKLEGRSDSIAPYFTSLLERSAYSIDQYALAFSMKNGSRSGIQYFLNHLQPDEWRVVVQGDIDILINALYSTSSAYPPYPPPVEHYVDCLYYVLSKMDESHRMTFLRRNAFRVLKVFLVYPFYGLFLKYVNRLKDALADCHFYLFLDEILRLELVETDFYGYEVFRWVWINCPDHEKKRLTSYLKKRKDPNYERMRKRIESIWTSN
ncbi:ANK_REP_REGION domain-containing protein [Nephila pilipes]|uniref:ANK_REP_REGION domain-containing protein n=1 Tax=Nephila pilipes TaxID=299642 RepID=A0A8X6N344_NEPPI|nr:ANK_REP_REGION domain-containing protein [Nephila pilipes]